MLAIRRALRASSVANPAARKVVQGGGIERLMHRVARLRMREVEREQRCGRQAGARAAERDARVREAAQRVPRILIDWRWRLVVHHAPIHSMSGCVACVSSAPRSSVMPIASSHASNSGARFRPSTSRTYSASWNDVLW